MRCFKKVILLLGIALTQLSFGQEIYSIDQRQMTIEYVDSVIAAYEAGEMEKPVYNLNKVIHISEQLAYTKGVSAGYDHVIELHKGLGEFPLELRNILLFSNYLGKKALFEEQSKRLYRAGNIYYNYELYEKALTSYLMADGNGDVDYVFGTQLKKQIALTYFKLENYEDAELELILLGQTARSKKDWNTALWSLQQIGKIKHVQKQYTDELNLSKEIVELTDSLGLENEHNIAINNLAYTFRYLEKYDEAIAYLEPLISKGKTERDAFVYQNLAILYQNKKELEQAKTYFQEAYQIHKRNKNYYYQAYLLDFITLMSYQESDFHSALLYNEETIYLAKKHKIGDVYQSGYYTRVLIDQGLFEYEDALKHLNRHLEIKDSLQTIKDRKQSQIELQQLFLDRTEDEVQMHFISEEIKDLEIQRLRAEQDANAERLKRFASDSLLNMQKIITQQLQLKEVRNQLELQKQALEIQEKENEVRMLAEQKEKQALALELEKAERHKQENALLMEQQRGKILEFELNERAAFLRNLIYLSLGLLLIILLIILFYLNLRKRKKEIERQRVLIAAEKEKADKLLLNILPVTVAEELKEKGKTEPRHYEQISIIFTDFSGFTKISENLTPVQLVEKLDAIFLEFDLIVEKYGLNRIKTIGDAYMCAAGLPDEDPKHAENAVRAALEMRDYIDNFNAGLQKGEPTWNVRIGVNTGPVVAGVVGIRKFAYDIWGDAVNVAARMESSGEISKVNVSESTYALVKGMVKANHRGKIYAKNKGDIDMYFIDEIKN